MFKYLRSINFWFNFIFYVVFLGLILPTFSIFFRGKEKIVSFFSRLLLKISWISVEAAGKENLREINKTKGLIIAVNHASFLDYFALQAKFPLPLKFVVWSAGFRIPLLKTIYQQMGYIGVGLKESSYLLYKTLKEGSKLVVFSKPATAGEEKIEFTDGILRLSSTSQAPILPVAIRGSSKVLPLGKFLLGHGKIKIGIGKPQFFNSVQDLQKEILRLYLLL